MNRDATAEGAVGDSREAPLVAHVEVGGALGGSILSLGWYLKHCDPERFGHKVIFYRPTEGALGLVGAQATVTTLDISAPGPAQDPRGATASRLRSVLRTIPGVARGLSTILEVCRFLACLPSAVRLARHFSSKRVVLIHVNNTLTFQVPTLLAAWWVGKPVVGHFRTLRSLTRLERYLAGRVARVVAINETVAQDLRRQGLSGLIRVCHDAIDLGDLSNSPEALAGLRRSLLGDGTVLVGTVSRLDEPKRVEDLLAATRLLVPSVGGLRVVIVGDGPRALHLRGLVDEWGLQEHVRFAGYQRNALDYIACLDVFVCTSRWDGGPRTVVEAMALGKPVVSTPVGIVPQLITAEYNGLLIPPADPQALAAALRFILQHPVEAFHLGARAAESVRFLCDPREAASRLDEIFVEVLGKSNE